MTHHTSGNRRPHQYRPSDHLAGLRQYIHGDLVPMKTARKPGLLARLMGKG